ncbi:phosphomannomutase/phosphoglucomutase [bacterium]|nr:phosphomannomutase/phosphoglucomutase [bacterium]
MYDIRGIADQDLSNEAVVRIGKAYGTFVKRRNCKTISVGRDVRLTSERIKNALADGVRSTGINIIDIGVCPTPVVYYSLEHLKTDGSVMITGSHNPIEFNGLKMNLGMLSIYGDDILHIKSLIEQNDFETGRGSLKEKNILPEYQTMLKKKIKLNQPFKVVMDAGNGTAGPVAPEIFRALGCEVIELYTEPDGRFPNHLPDPTVMKNIRDLQKKVVEEKAAFGLGYDGDSDRVGLIDETGNPVYADKILALLARDVLERNPGDTIIFDVKCSQMLPEEIERLGGKPLMWMTGHSLIKKKMKEEGAPLAGEMSGHIFFKDGYFGFDDGIYVSLRFAAFLSRQQKTVSQLVDELPVFMSTPEIRVSCPDAEKFSIVKQLVSDFRKDYPVIDVDGARVQFGDGWGLVRASNTQPAMVMRFEAKTEKRMNEIRQIFRKELLKYPSVQMNETDEDSGH